MSQPTKNIHQSYKADPSRPTYHYLPAKNWMNDPNGVIQWNGRYHLFYQYNPLGPLHANMHWGHAVSDDMVHWHELPIALAPTPNTYDEGGIFSGCIVDNAGDAVAVYTGVNQGYDVQQQCLAHSSDPDLQTWQKSAQNPVLNAPPANADQTADFRDPFVWREGDDWKMIVGSRIEGIGGAVFLYRSKDLTEWEYLHPLHVGDLARHGVMWECPNFFQLGDKWVLIISSHIGYATGTVLYFVGDYCNDRFYPEYEAVLDSAYYYAPLTHLDDQSRRIMWAWLREGRSDDHQLAAGWSGVQAIPRVLSLDQKNRLLMSPAPELETIRGTHHHFTAADVDETPLPVQGLALDIEVSFAINGGANCGLAVAAAPDGSESTTIIYDPVTETLRVRRHSTEDGLELHPQGRQHRLDPDETLDLRILIDGSVLEIIANQRTSLTSRIYPIQAESNQLRILQPGLLRSLDIYEMSSIW